MYEVITKNSVEGFHAWLDAPAAVSFLKERHRHIFEIRCWFNVADPDREIEIIMQQWEIGKYLNDRYGTPCEFGGMSCEMIANELLERFGCSAVEVLEDGDGGAIVRQ